MNESSAMKCHIVLVVWNEDTRRLRSRTFMSRKVKERKVFRSDNKKEDITCLLPTFPALGTTLDTSACLT